MEIGSFYGLKGQNEHDGTGFHSDSEGEWIIKPDLRGSNVDLTTLYFLKQKWPIFAIYDSMSSILWSTGWKEDTRID